MKSEKSVGSCKSDRQFALGEGRSGNQHEALPGRRTGGLLKGAITGQRRTGELDLQPNEDCRGARGILQPRGDVKQICCGPVAEYAQSIPRCRLRRASQPCSKKKYAY